MRNVLDLNIGDLIREPIFGGPREVYGVRRLRGGGAIIYFKSSEVQVTEDKRLYIIKEGSR